MGQEIHKTDEQTTKNQTGCDVTEKLLTRREVAQRWRCCEHTIMRRGDLRPLVLGPRFIRYRLANVLEIEAAASV
jgi:hypothetical protein